jgi:sugar-specific transcriptional regulator TrmB
MNGEPRLHPVESRASELLQLYGLNEREALVYLLVLRSGSASAGDVAKALSVRRMEAYRLVKKLTDASLLRANAGKPVTYSAQPVDEVVSRMMGAHTQKNKAMEAGREELLLLVRSMPRGRPRPSEQQFRMIQGREQIYNRIGRMADEANERLSLLLTRNDLVQALQLGIVDKLTKAASRGVKVEVLGSIDESSLEAAEAIQKECEMRHSADAAYGRLALQDGVAALSSLVLDDSQGRRNEQDIAVSSESPDYSQMLASLFDVAFKAAQPGRERIDAIKESKSAGDKLRSLVEVLQVTLPEDGWQISAPGVIIGKSGASYAFPLIAQKAKRTLAIEVVVSRKEQDARDRAVQSVMKKLDLADAEVVVAVMPSAGEEVVKLGRLVGVSIVSARDTIGTVSELRKLLRGQA